MSLGPIRWVLLVSSPFSKLALRLKVPHTTVRALDPEALRERSQAAIDAIYDQSDSANRPLGFGFGCGTARRSRSLCQWPPCHVEFLITGGRRAQHQIRCNP